MAVRCQVCLHTHVARKVKKTYIRCMACDTFQSSEKLKEEELFDFYSDYYALNQDSVPLAVRNRLKETVHKFSSFRSELNAICDVGFGSGTLLEVAEELGWNCYGTEASKAAIQLTSQKFWKLHLGDLTSSNFGTQFDVVTLVETLEHVTNPEQILREIQSALRPGGIVYGTTPNGLALNFRLLQYQWSVFSSPEHQNILNRYSLKTLLSRLGFVNIEISSSGFNPYDLLNLVFQSPVVTSSRARKFVLSGRVETGYQLVNLRQSSLPFRVLSSVVQGVLNSLGLGDTLVFRAQKRQD